MNIKYYDLNINIINNVKIEYFDNIKFFKSSFLEKKMIKIEKQ